MRNFTSSPYSSFSSSTVRTPCLEERERKRKRGYTNFFTSTPGTVHAKTHTKICSHTASLAHTLPLSLTHCPSCSHTASLAHTLPLLLTHCLSHSHTASLAHTLPLSCSLHPVESEVLECFGVVIFLAGEVFVGCGTGPTPCRFFPSRIVTAASASTFHWLGANNILKWIAHLVQQHTHTNTHTNTQTHQSIQLSTVFNEQP